MKRTDPPHLVAQIARWAIAGVVVVVFLFSIGRIIGWIPEKSQICEYNQYYRKEECSAHDTVLVITRKGVDIFNYASPAIGAIATVFVGLFTYTLWLTSRDQHDRLRESIDEAKVASRQELRAYVTVEIGGIKNTGPNLSPVIEIIMHNVGQTPAYKVSVSWEQSLVFIGSDVDLTRVYADELERGGLSIGPGRSLTNKQFDYVSLLPTAIEEVINNKLAIIATGVVIYDDIFGEICHTWFCHRYNGPQWAGSYNPFGNEAD